MKRAEELEPLAPLFPADFAWQLLNVGRLDAAMDEVRKSLELNPQFAQALAVMGWIVAEKRMYPEAIAAHQKAALADHAWKWPLGRTFALAGNKEQARLIALDMQKEPGPMDEWGLAVIYAALGEKDEAFRWLDAAYRSRFSWMPYNRDFVRPDFFASLRDDPRFDGLMRRVLVRSGGVLPRLPR